MQKHKDPTISVLMPVFNAESFVEEAIRSILTQTFHDFEIIILDDASTDASLKSIRKIARSDRRIRIYQNTKNLDIAASRNRLLKLARGTYIAWQDADDMSLPKRLEQQFAFLEKHPEVGMVGGFLKILHAQGTTSIRRYAAGDSELRKKILRYSPVAQPAAMIRKSILDQVGSYGTTLSPAEDIDMSFRIGRVAQFANLQTTLIKYRDMGNSATYKRLRKAEIVTLQTRWYNVTRGYYPFTVGDILYNLIQLSTMCFMPPSWRITLFNKLRNTRNE